MTFILTMWYVNIQPGDECLVVFSAFILTMWYVNYSVFI